MEQAFVTADQSATASREALRRSEHAMSRSEQALGLTERTLFRSEECFQLLIASVTEYAIFAVDTSGNITAWNVGAERITGYKEEEVLGRPFSMFTGQTEEQIADFKNELAGAAKVGHAENEGWRTRKDGTRFWANTVLTALRNETGELIGFGKVMRDMTERRQAEQVITEKMKELTRSNVELEQFAYVASHDLQEPLRMVTSYVQLLARRYKGKLGSDADDFIGYAVDGVTRMQQLINDLLAFSRVGTRGGNFEITNLQGVFEDVMLRLQIARQESGAVITADPLPRVVADRTQITQLFQNLVGNAIKFRKQDEPPKVHIAVTEKGRDWRFAVKDSGIGFDQEYADRIFVIFQRLHARGEFPGTGIGLAICKKIVERHGGRIWAESTLGEGATFHFTLPRECAP